MGVQPLPREYHTRINKRSTVIWALGAPTAALLLKIWTEPFPLPFQLSVTVVSVAGYLFVVTLSPRGFTSADQYGVSWRSGLRTKRLVWADLHDIRQVTPPAAAVGRHRPQDVAYAYRVDGRRFLLPYLSAKELGDEGLRREVTILRDVMNEQHGGARVADPLVEAHIARHAARYARRYRALTGRTSRSIFLIALFAIIVVCTTTFE